MADLLENLRNGLKFQNQVDGSQLSILAYKNFLPEQIVESRNIGNAKPIGNLIHIYKDSQEAKPS